MPMVTNEMKLLTSFGDIKNLLSKMIFCNKTNAIRQKMCYNHISITGSDFLKGDLKMSENTNSPAESGSERELTELEKSIVSDFKQLNEENQLAVIDFILSLLK